MTAVYAGARSAQAGLSESEIVGREMRDLILEIDSIQARCNDLQAK